MLKLYHGASVENLTAQLSSLIKNDPLQDPFRKEVIVVQNHGMARWLSMQLAKMHGIAANLKFQFPAEAVWSVYRSVDNTIPEKLPSDRESMKWTIYKILRELPDRPPFRFLYHYTHPDESTFDAQKGWELSNTIADLFDEYIVYRPEMIQGWEQNQMSTREASESWQMQLWLKMANYWSAFYKKSGWHHRVDIHQQCLNVLNSSGADHDRLPVRLSLLGISTMPASFVELFAELSKLIDIHWFRRDPAGPTGLKKSADEGGQSLVSAFAEEGIAFLDMMKNTVQQSGATMETETAGDEAGRPASFLERVRNGVLSGGEGSPIADAAGDDAVADRSIQIHSCHSPVREVEVLFDQLLELFAADDDLHPDDILVVIPELSDYASAIDSVFGAGEKDLPSLPYHIIQEIPGTHDPVYIGLTKMLELLESRFKVTEVFDLLWMEPVRKAYNIDADQLNRLQRWVQNTQVRWGLDAKEKIRNDLPAAIQNTFTSGLHQMLLGFAAEADEELYRGIYPYDEIDTTDDAELMGRFTTFIQDLKNARDEITESHKPAEWRRISNRWLDLFFASDDIYFSSISSMRTLLEATAEAAALGGYGDPLPFSVWSKELITGMEKEQGGGGYFGQGITFSGLNPMRNIPHKVIAFIGMNSGVFPRSDIIPEFDLMRKNPKPGDRIKRKDDRYLFLESMMSARDVFYLSYVGRSNRDDESRPPSVVVSELIDLIETSFDLDNGFEIEKHRLHAYSPQYFKEDSEKFSYSRSNAEVCKTYLKESDLIHDFFPAVLPLSSEKPRSIAVQELIKFFRHPARYLLQERLGIYFNEENILEEEREPFVFQGLERYQMENELLKRSIQGDNVEALREIAKSRGELPAGFPGDYYFDEIQKKIEPFIDQIHKLTGNGHFESIGVDLAIGDFSVTGNIDDLSNNLHLAYRYGSRNSRDLITAWIEHLLLQSMQAEFGTDGFSTLLLTRKSKTGEVVKTSFGPVDDAVAILHTLLQIYWNGLQEKTPLFPETSWCFAYRLFEKNDGKEYSLKKASDKWYSEYNEYPQESLDPYNRALYSDQDPLQSRRFSELAATVFKPLIEHKIEY